MSDPFARGASQGPTLGRYHLVEPIGGGPTGEVFRAKVYGVAGFERQFAVKRFFPAITAVPARAELIAQAARAYQTIEHPRIARLHEYGVVNGQAFVAVELVGGVDLARLVAATHGVSEPLSPGSALSMIAQLARSLAYAHGRGVLHLGLCPTNVILTPDGDAKVMDFGFLRARLPEKAGEDATLAARLPYLAPEQLVGGQLSPGSDVFQLASLTFELLTGERAFGGATIEETAARVMSGVTLAPPVPQPIAIVLARALNPDPDSRYLDAGAFADSLDAAIRQAPLPGGRTDLANAVRRVQGRAKELEQQQMSGAVSFPLPAPPASELAAFAPPVAPKKPAPPPVPVDAGGAPPELHDLASTDDVATTVRNLPAQPQKTILGMPAVTPPPPPKDVEFEFSPIPAVAPPPVPPPPAVAPPPAAASVPPVTPAPAFDSGSPLLAEALAAESPPLALTPPPVGDDDPTRLATKAAPAPRRGGSRWLIAVFAVVALGAGGYVGWSALAGGDGEGKATKPVSRAKPAAPKPAAAPDAGAKVAVAPPVAPIDAGTAGVPPPDAAPVAAAPPDAAPAVAVAPTAPTPTPPTPAPPTGDPSVVRFVSEPPGASVYLDGALKGETPFELPASGDRHRVVFVLEGHSLHRTDAEGRGVVSATLTPVPPRTGDAGIKVKCKSKGRFYVIVDGVETGLLCPTERIKVTLGTHTVEVYDPVTDATSTHKVDVADTHNSVRVKLDD